MTRSRRTRLVKYLIAKLWSGQWRECDCFIVLCTKENEQFPAGRKKACLPRVASHIVSKCFCEWWAYRDNRCSRNTLKFITIYCLIILFAILNWLIRKEFLAYSANLRSKMAVQRRLRVSFLQPKARTKNHSSNLFVPIFIAILPGNNKECFKVIRLSRRFGFV